MKVFFIILILLQNLAQLPFGPPLEKTEDESSHIKGWRMVSYFPVPPTHYSKVSKGVIKAESVGSRSSLFKDIGEKEKNLPILSWRWKVSNVIRSAIETRKDRFDAPARVMVIFGKEKDIRFFGL